MNRLLSLNFYVHAISLYSCFISDLVVFFAAFLGPILLLVFINAIMFICITFVQLRYICCLRRKRSKDDKDGPKMNVGENFVIVLKIWCLLCLFGLTWLFGALTITRSTSFLFSTLFAVFTSLQGFFIFLFLCLLSKDAINFYKRLCCKDGGESYATSKSGSAQSYSTKSSSLASKNLYVSSKPLHDDATKQAFTQELSTKIKLYENVPEEIKTSTFKPSY